MFPFKPALNASTLFPFKLEVKEQVRIAAEAGYAGVELWVKDLDAYLSNGGTVKQLKRYITDTGIEVVNAIAFFAWSDENEAERERAFVQAEKEMVMLAELGCAAVAAPPFGNVERVSLESMAESFAMLSELARKIGIKPYLEFWGRAKKLSRLSEAIYVAMESGAPNAQILLDPFHMYTGGSRVENLAYLNGERIGIVHVNDYPAAPARDVIADRNRVFPGAGCAPSQQFASTLYDIGYRGYLSLELFIEDFGTKSALDVAKFGLESVTDTYQVKDVFETR
ncbi:Sugar phosphate isomerase/epimerase [Paenibacillus sp. yr247]|uniref:sugar phosphate isomerase/epimerase family protein n=1 Tax=Paenibacillus sp. yr247 TaxID=1761880 RepID=UPI00089273BA|nr:sugar phosphate isomerase/epimerase family protein [Paenibacillus sp. yr247]SDO42593.1 Sugar phosphate isomerase/epimerase [Paenibacillus sp. yr247]